MADEITAKQLEDKDSIDGFKTTQIREISDVVGSDGLAINALSGGVDSSTVTMLGHTALRDRLKTYFIENGLMREGEPEYVVSVFQNLGVQVEVVDAREQFFAALKGITGPEEKREAITQTFYKEIFGRLVKESGAKYLLQGTILTDVDETAAGIKRQHNVFEQIGIDPQEAFGYKIIEPLVQLRKDGVRMVAEALELPEEIYNRKPFPGPALAARVIGEVTPEKIETVRQATAITEYELADVDAFQSMTILHPEELKGCINQSAKAAKIVAEQIGGDYLVILYGDRVTGMRNGKRDFGLQIGIKNQDVKKLMPPWEDLDILAGRLTSELLGVVSVNYDITPKLDGKEDGNRMEIRCWNSIDARTAKPTRLPYETLEILAKRMTGEVPGVVSVTYNITEKPPSTMEAI